MLHISGVFNYKENTLKLRRQICFVKLSDTCNNVCTVPKRGLRMAINSRFIWGVSICHVIWTSARLSTRQPLANSQWTILPLSTRSLILGDNSSSRMLFGFPPVNAEELYLVTKEFPCSESDKFFSHIYLIQEISSFQFITIS